MHRLGIMLIVLSVSSTTLLAQQQTPQHERRNLAAERSQQRDNRPGMDSINIQYNLITKELKLTGDQKKKMKKEFDLLQQDAQSFREDSRDQLREQQEDQRRVIIQNLNTQWEKIIGDHNAAINGILTPEQREQWQEIRLNNVIRIKLSMVDFNPEQEEKFKQLIHAAAAEVAKVDGKNIAALNAAQGKLLKEILTNVLSDEQLSRLLLAVQAPIGMGWGRFGGDWFMPTGGGDGGNR